MGHGTGCSERADAEDSRGQGHGRLGEGLGHVFNCVEKVEVHDLLGIFLEGHFQVREESLLEGGS